MGTITLRIKEITQHLGIGVGQFEKSIDVGHATISKAINSDKSIGSDILHRILQKYPEISAEWLMRGEGDMLLNMDSDSINNRNISNNGDFNGVNGNVNINTAKAEHHTLIDEVVFLRGQINEKDKQITFFQSMLAKFNI